MALNSVVTVSMLRQLGVCRFDKQILNKTFNQCKRFLNKMFFSFKHTDF